jgi:hypothetical protein
MYFPILLITGAGRSGTGIAARILGSAERTIFSYEPSWLRAIVPLLGTKELGDAAARFLLEICIHDVEFYPQLLGRMVNLRPGYSNTFNYLPWDELIRRLALPDRRRDYETVIRQTGCSYVTKLPDMYLVLGKLLELLPQLKIVHLVRDGRDVVASGLRRQWYTDEFYRDWTVTWFADAGGPTPVPWFVAPEHRRRWRDWNAATRAAYGWCLMVRHALAVADLHPGRVLNVGYEGFRGDVEREAERIARWAGLTLSHLSRGHMRALTDYDQASYDAPLPLAPDVASEFASLQQTLGYKGA